MISNGNDTKVLTDRLHKLIPGKVESVKSEKKKRGGDRLLIEMMKPADLQKKEWFKKLPESCRVPGKGFLVMENLHIRIFATDSNGMANAQKLLLRFAELAKAEK